MYLLHVYGGISSRIFPGVCLSCVSHSHAETGSCSSHARRSRTYNRSSSRTYARQHARTHARDTRMQSLLQTDLCTIMRMHTRTHARKNMRMRMRACAHSRLGGGTMNVGHAHGRMRTHASMCACTAAFGGRDDKHGRGHDGDRLPVGLPFFL